MTFIKNIESDYGAVGDGTTNDRPAFLTWRAAAAGLDSELILRAGAHYFMGDEASPSSDINQYIFSGTPTLLVRSDTPGTRATITDGGDGYDFHLGAFRNIYLDGSFHAAAARIEEVAAGASTVVLQTDADHSKYTVGDWIIVCGFSLQGAGGFPPNWHYFEFKQIISKQTSVSPYTITLDSPLAYTYLTDWPSWGAGDYAMINGPASIHRMDPTWDCDHEYRDLGVEKYGTPNPLGGGRKSTNCNGRAITLRNVYPSNYDGVNPSFSISHKLYGCDYTNVNMEVDKLIDEMLFDDCQMGSVTFQSSSVKLLTMNNGTTIASGFLNGTPQQLVVEDCNIGIIYPGAIAYGCGAIGGITLTNTVLQGFNNNVAFGGRVYDGGAEFGSGIGVDAGLNSMSGGVIKIDKWNYGALASAWAIPGSYCMWRDGHRLCMGMFRIESVTDDDDYIIIQTSESGGFPTAGFGVLKIATHPCSGPVTVTGSSQSSPAGTDDGFYIYGLNGTAYPLYSYFRFRADGKAPTEGEGSILWGNLVDVSYNVTAATAGAKTFIPTGVGIVYTKEDGTAGEPGYQADVDFHEVGERTIIEGVPSSFLGVDNFALPEYPFWATGRPYGVTAGGVLGSGSQSITVTYRTDQGIEDVEVTPSVRTYTITFT
jgi:hypothetical protein